MTLRDRIHEEDLPRGWACTCHSCLNPEAFESGAAEERAAIVRWLRTELFACDASFTEVRHEAAKHAAAIERGEHHVYLSLFEG